VLAEVGQRDEFISDAEVGCSGSGCFDQAEPNLLNFVYSGSREEIGLVIERACPAGPSGVNGNIKLTPLRVFID